VRYALRTGGLTVLVLPVRVNVAAGRCQGGRAV
jgi:hypothetical protein